MTIVWDESLATGVEEIDAQHREIFDRFNKLFTACSEGRGKEEVMKSIAFLREYVQDHFSLEEKLQQRSNYPGYAAHKSQHNAFILDVDRLEKSFNEEGATLSLVIMTNKALTSWLLQHISKVDTEFAKHLKTGA